MKLVEPLRDGRPIPHLPPSAPTLYTFDGLY